MWIDTSRTPAAPAQVSLPWIKDVMVTIASSPKNSTTLVESSLLHEHDDEGLDDALKEAAPSDEKARAAARRANALVELLSQMVPQEIPARSGIAGRSVGRVGFAATTSPIRILDVQRTERLSIPCFCSDLWLPGTREIARLFLRRARALGAGSADLQFAAAVPVKITRYRRHPRYGEPTACKCIGGAAITNGLHRSITITPWSTPGSLRTLNGLKEPTRSTRRSGTTNSTAFITKWLSSNSESAARLRMPRMRDSDGLSNCLSASTA